MKALLLAFCLAVSVAPVVIPVPASAQAAADQQKDDEKQKSDSEPLQKIEVGHGRKVIRPGGAVEPIFVWRKGATLATLVALAGALILSLPVAAVYEFTNRKRTTLDRGVTQSILLLPPIVAGIVMVVQNSLALAFSLAGVATTVRFRAGLKDTNDAAYIFLAIAIGIACGAQALDVAAVVSGGACVIALIVFALSSVVRQPPVPVSAPPSNKADGAPKADGATKPDAAPAPQSADDARSATIVVSAPHDEHARSAVESLLDGLTKEWRLDTLENNSLEDEARLRYIVRTKKRLDVDALLSAINAAGASQGIHAEIDHGKAPTEAPKQAPAEAPKQAPPSSPAPATSS